MFSLDATLLAELVVFGVVLLIMSKVVLPPLRRAMEARRVLIEQGLSATDQAQARLAALDHECARRLAEARREGREILATYQAMGEQAERDLRAKAQQERQRILAAARREAALGR